MLQRAFYSFWWCSMIQREPHTSKLNFYSINESQCLSVSIPYIFVIFTLNIHVFLLHYIFFILFSLFMSQQWCFLFFVCLWIFLVCFFSINHFESVLLFICFALNSSGDRLSTEMTQNTFGAIRGKTAFSGVFNWKCAAAAQLKTDCCCFSQWSYSINTEIFYLFIYFF